MQQSNNSNIHPALMQIKNNTIYWVGHLPNDFNEHFAGQTFVSPKDGLIDNIQIYADLVQRPGDILLTFHSFDADHKKWGQVLRSSTVSLERKDSEKWIPFFLPDLPIQKEMVYGFRVHTAGALVGIGEAAGVIKNRPYTFGQEWKGSSAEDVGEYYSYFSLVFKIELRH
jgi:hypothetical protein